MVKKTKKIIVLFSAIVLLSPQNLAFANDENGESTEVEEKAEETELIQSEEVYEDKESLQNNLTEENPNKEDPEIIEDGEEVSDEQDVISESQDQNDIQQFNVKSTPKYSDGDKGDHVKELKENLTQLGFGNFPENPSTTYGPVTTKVVKEFQIHYNLPESGIADQVTLDKIDELLNPPYKNGHRGLHIAQFKKDLTQLGFGNFPQNPSLAYGSITAGVVKEFQSVYGLNANGVANQQTLDKIQAILTSDYSPGENGSHVRELKKNLTQLGFGNFPKNPSTAYGSVTAGVVKEFQAHYKLPESGIVDQVTLGKIDEMLHPPYENGHRGLHIVKLKKDLTQLGFGNFPKNPSLSYGPVTASVVKEFQSVYGLNANGVANQQTLDKIQVILTSDYSPGKNGSHIRELKKNLTQLGFGNFPKKPSTAYGSVTAGVVREFQAHYRLPESGIVDQVTIDKIDELLNPPYKNGHRGLHIVQLKKDLTQLGFGNFPKNPSLAYGSVTVNVVKEFQKFHGLIEDGIAGSATLTKIKLELDQFNKKPTIKTTYTNYGITLSKALDIQLDPERLQLTDKYRNDPAYVSGEYLEFIGSGIITGSTVNVRTEPNLKSNTKAYTLKNGDKINLVSTVQGASYSNSTLWYKIENNKKHCYVHSSLLTGTRAKVVNTGSLNVRAGTNTGTHIYGKLKRNNTVTVKYPVGSWYSIEYSAWRNATRSDLQQYLDPNKNDKFQHLRLDKLAGATASQLNSVLPQDKNNVLYRTGVSFISGARDSSINEAYLVAHALLETGHGTSKLATGVEVGKNSKGELVLVTDKNRKSLKSIKTTYNMFGIGAADKDPLRLGAIRAYEEGWFTPEKAIEDGANWVGESYIYNQYNQNTLYKMRWNPQMEKASWKQYASDIGWSTKQVTRIKEIYEKIDNANIHYDIAKYN